MIIQIKESVYLDNQKYGAENIFTNWNDHMLI